MAFAQSSHCEVKGGNLLQWATTRPASVFLEDGANSIVLLRA